MNLECFSGSFGIGNYCLDFSIDYCSGNATPELRAIINDRERKLDEVKSTFEAHMLTNFNVLSIRK